MKPVPSVLKILDFAVTKMDFEFVTSKAAGIKIKGFPDFDNYEIDLDFNVFKEDYLQVVMSVDINNIEKPLPGYRISARVATVFEFGDISALTADQKKSIEGFSTVYMALNNLRGIISGFTANAPFGRYTLPSIDLNDLIKRKQQTVKQEITEKTTVKLKTKAAKNA